MKKFFLPLALAAALSTSAFAQMPPASAPVSSGPQQPITGVVTNKSTGKPAAGDTVTLIQLANGMQESTRTTTDARGHYSLPVPDGGMHLVRVTHDKVPYFQPARPGTNSINVDVYNGAPQVSGVHGEADVVRVQAQGNEIQFTELWAIENESDPPTTQFSARAFEFWLPKGAEITGGAALGPNGMPVQQKPVPLDEPGHYAFVFPIRPGETRFQLTYKVVYAGKLDVAPRLSMPFNNVAIMLPKSMKFTGVPAFQPVNDQVDAQVFLAKGVSAQQKLDYTVSGTGLMPQDSAQQQQGEQGPDAAAGAQPAAQDQRPGGGLGNPEGGPGPLEKRKWLGISAMWWLLIGIAAIFGGGLWFAMRKPAMAGEVAAAPLATPVFAPSAARTSTLEVLKDELFRLETARLEGRISDAKYAELKAALETVLRHALERDAGPVAAERV